MSHFSSFRRISLFSFLFVSFPFQCLSLSSSLLFGFFCCLSLLLLIVRTFSASVSLQVFEPFHRCPRDACLCLRVEEDMPLSSFVLRILLRLSFLFEPSLLDKLLFCLCVGQEKLFSSLIPSPLFPSPQQTVFFAPSLFYPTFLVLVFFCLCFNSSFWFCFDLFSSVGLRSLPLFFPLTSYSSV